MSRLTVVHTVSGLAESRGGTTRSASLLCEYVAREGVDVILLANRWKSGEDPVYEPPDSLVRRVFVPAFESRALRIEYGPTFSRVLKGVIGDFSPSLLQDHGLWLPSNHSAAVVCRQLRLPRVASVHGMLLSAAMRTNAWKKRLAWTFYQRKDLQGAALIWLTSSDELQALGGMGLQVPAAVIPHGVELPPMARPASAQRDRLAVFIGRVHPIKGLMELVQSWKAASPPLWKLVIAGPAEGGHDADLRKAVADAGLESGVAIRGAVDDAAKWELLSRASLFILPSKSENFGLALAEALAAGVPAIATKGTPWRRLVEERCGWWVDATVDALTDAIRAATAKEPQELAAMGKRGRSLVERDHGWRKCAVDMISAYEWILGGRRPDFIQA